MVNVEWFVYDRYKYDSEISALDGGLESVEDFFDKNHCHTRSPSNEFDSNYSQFWYPSISNYVQNHVKSCVCLSTAPRKIFLADNKICTAMLIITSVQFRMVNVRVRVNGNRCDSEQTQHTSEQCESKWGSHFD